MPDNALKNTDGLRTVRRRSLTRRAWCDAELPRELADILFRGDPDRLLFSSNPLQVKDRCVVAQHECPSGPLLVKRHAWGDPLRTLRMAFREPAAHRCARLGLHLHDRGIPTPRPRAYADCRVWPWTYRSYLVSDYIEGQSLYRYIRFGSQSDDELRRVARQVAGIWENLVELGVSHNDLKPENFIVDHNLDVWLIDLEKVRLRGKPQRQRQRQVFDVQNFLHVRGWHHRFEARAMFAEAFLQTRYREWLDTAGVDRAATLALSGGAPIDPELSVLILCGQGIELSLARRAIDSVRDIADEVVFVEASASTGLNVLKRIDVCDAQPVPLAHSKKISTKSAPPLVRYPWVLVLQQDESVTPFLAKELQQRIADERAGDMFRIPIEKQFFGKTVARAGSEIAPVRLLRQSASQFQGVDDLLSIAADGQRTSQLIGSIQRCECATVDELVERFNEQTTNAAMCRLTADEQPHLVRAALGAVRKFIGACVGRGGIRSGWTGLQIAALESIFTCVEEAKLYQFAREFRDTSSHGEHAAGDGAQLTGAQTAPDEPLAEAA